MIRKNKAIEKRRIYIKVEQCRQKKLIYANYVAEKARQGGKIDQLLKNMYSNFIGCDYRIHR